MFAKATRLSASWMSIASGSKPTTARRNCRISTKVPRSLSMWTLCQISNTKAASSASPMPPVARTRSSPSTMLRATSLRSSNASPSASPWMRIAQKTCKNSKPAIVWSARLSTKVQSTKYKVTNLPPLCCIRLFEQRCHIDGENCCLLLLLIIFRGD